MAQFNVTQNDLGGPTGLMSALTDSIAVYSLGDQAVWCKVIILTPVGPDRHYIVSMLNQLLHQTSYYGGVRNGVHAISCTIEFPAEFTVGYSGATVDTSIYTIYTCPPATPAATFGSVDIILPGNTYVIFKFYHWELYPSLGAMQEHCEISIAFKKGRFKMIMEQN